MLKHIIIAIFVLIFAPLGQAQENAQSPEASTEDTQEAENASPSPLPVILKSDEEQQPGQSVKDEAEQRQIDDLAAQQSMDAAAHRTANYAFWQTWIVGLGTIALFYTLWLMQRANSVAMKAVEINRKMFEAEYRPHVLLDNTMEIMDAHLKNSVLPNGKLASGHYWRIQIGFFNHGNSTCALDKIECGWGSFDYAEFVDGVDMWSRGNSSAHINPPKSRCGSIYVFVSDKELESMKQGRARTVVSYNVVYSSGMEGSEKYTFQGSIEISFGGMRQVDANSPLLPEFMIENLPSLDEQYNRYNDRAEAFKHL